MCYRTEGDIEATKIAKYWEKRLAEGYKGQPAKEFNGFAYPELPVSTCEEPDLIQPMRWGLIPAWVKGETQAQEMQSHTLNAVGETIFDKPSFRSILRKRCLIYVTGFYEWQLAGKSKIKYLLKVRDMPSFALGGLYETWINRKTEIPYTGFSIITCRANELMAKIHNTKKRMPFILNDKEKAAEWLADLSKEEIKMQLKPFPEERMEALQQS